MRVFLLCASNKSSSGSLWKTSLRSGFVPTISSSLHRQRLLGSSRSRSGIRNKRRHSRRSGKHRTTEKTVSEAKPQQQSSNNSSSVKENGGLLSVLFRRVSHKLRNPQSILPNQRFGVPYTREQTRALAVRLPFCCLLSLALIYASPVGQIRIHGPSMLPTMAADESDIWLIAKYHWRKLLRRIIMGSCLVWPPTLQRGDLVGFSHPEQPDRISCKRVVGLPGDRIQRYGQFVHLYERQDPVHLGVQWPEDTEHNNGEEVYSWMKARKNWWEDSTSATKTVDARTEGDAAAAVANNQTPSRRTLIVPPNHVWLEADCPVLGLDSRHFGPVPMDWLQGRVLCRMWPLTAYQSSAGRNHRQRPHPIPLDDESLVEYNVFRVRTKNEVVRVTKQEEDRDQHG